MKKRRYWKLREEELDRAVWRTGLKEAINLSQDRLRNERMEYDCST